MYYLPIHRKFEYKVEKLVWKQLWENITWVPSNYLVINITFKLKKMKIIRNIQDSTIDRFVYEFSSAKVVVLNRDWYGPQRLTAKAELPNQLPSATLMQSPTISLESLSTTHFCILFCWACFCSNYDFANWNALRQFFSAFLLLEFYPQIVHVIQLQKLWCSKDYDKSRSANNRRA